MTLNTIGVVAAIATFFSVWFGHVAVRKIEFVSPTIWLPTIIALIIGLALEVVALSSADSYGSGALGIVGITVLFDAIEFTRQSRRIQKGHAPANPNNPRHAKLLAEGNATTIDWLRRDPAGQVDNLTDTEQMI